MAEGGRGLALVAACTSRWGYAEAHPGRIVWAESQLAGPGPSPRGVPGAPPWPPGPPCHPPPAPPSGWPPGPAA